MINMLFVGLGGFIGSVMRYAISIIPISAGYFPVKTFVINFLGSFVLGCSGQVMSIHPEIPQHWLLFVQVGLCGGFTTFSTFSLESYILIRNGQIGIAIMYMAGSVLVCVMAVFLGMNTVKLYF